MNEAARAVLGALADCLPAGAVEVQVTDGRTRIWAPLARGADYRFYIETQDRGGACVSALPSRAPEGAFFWHLPVDYAPEEQGDALAQLAGETRRLLRNRSRILQTGGILLWRFRCEVEEAGGWRRVGGTIASPRLLFRPPFAFLVKRWEYHSDPPCPEGEPAG